jgi:conjugal transfer pilus assembly protein TraB
MASFQLNEWMKAKQRRRLLSVVLGISLVMIAIITLASGGKTTHKKDKNSAPDLTGIVDESFNEANTESALFSQQTDLEQLRAQVLSLQASVTSEAKAHATQIAALSAQVMQSTQRTPNDALVLASNAPNKPTTATDVAAPWQVAVSDAVQEQVKAHNQSRSRVHSVSFRYGPRKRHANPTDTLLNPQHYVPSGTFVRAVILGGADADASVNGQSKNNGVMLFKLLQQGTLPNGQHSRLQGCFITGSSYGDISSERAYVVLDKLSCAQPGQAIIDKAVTGWAFFGGKVGIKGQPLMRDNKVMQWAGISGAMAGIASAAQYSQSVQSISALGAAMSVPSSNIAPYAGYGGASKAADVLSNYYVKRAEQYHPVIQVGSGNTVTIVFKDGFYLEPDETIRQQGRQSHATRLKEAQLDEVASADNLNFNVPSDVLSQIDRAPRRYSQGYEP